MIDKMLSKIIKDCIDEKDVKEIEEVFLKFFTAIDTIYKNTYKKEFNGHKIETRYISSIETGSNYIKIDISDALVDIYKQLVEKIKNGEVR